MSSHDPQKTARIRLERCYARTPAGEQLVKRGEGATPRTLKLLSLCDNTRPFSELKEAIDMPSADLELWLADLCNRGLLEPTLPRIAPG
ncbi:MAG: hypothetical protein JNM90_10795 [Burkholderiales bacterium]|nr:hypothetical protein [Burkholderiales bacterium]